MASSRHAETLNRHHPQGILSVSPTFTHRWIPANDTREEGKSRHPRKPLPAIQPIRMKRFLASRKQ